MGEEITQSAGLEFEHAEGCAQQRRVVGEKAEGTSCYGLKLQHNYLIVPSAISAIVSHVLIRDLRILYRRALSSDAT